MINAAQGAQRGLDDGPKVGLLVAGKSAIEGCHKLLDELHALADFHVGVRGEPQVNKVPASVPNGLAEELKDDAYRLSERLASLYERLRLL